MRGDAMLELVPSEHDDPTLLRLVQRIVNGALVAVRAREVYLVHVDNWFDHKWLGFWSIGGELRVPPFNPNRVVSEQHFCWDEPHSSWLPVADGQALHVRQPGRTGNARPLDRFPDATAFLWYSGNTAANTAGSLMLYLSGAEGYAWYASFRKAEHWEIDGHRQIGRRELLSFEECGRRMESDPLTDPVSEVSRVGR